MAFRVGQKVVCIDTFAGGYGDEERPTIGGVYTIRGFDFERPDCICGVGLFLEEITNPIRPYRNSNVECSFPQSKFRPVVSTDIGMAILEQIRRDVTNKILRPIFEDEQV